MAVARHCLGCGQLTTRSYCGQCGHGVGRGRRRWRKLSATRVALDGCCAYCGSTEDLTVDLDPRLRSNHQLATIDDCVTACRRCNTRLH
jgi:5-methylcytosine-specific restriction endonuclease McrA